MRGPYVRFIKKYVDLNSKYHNIKEIRESLIKFGATHDEFNEALSQLKKTSPRSKFPKPTPDLIKKTATAIVTFVALISFVYTTFIYQKTNPSNNELQATNPAPKNILNDVLKNNDTSPNNPISQVYANLKPIDATKVFSIPPINTPLAITNKPKKEILGFFPYWMLPFADEIPINHLTSISLFGLEVNGKGEIVTAHDDNKPDGGWDMWKNPLLDSFIKKTNDQDVKVFLTFKSFNNTNTENLVGSDEAQKTFISNAIYLVNSKNLDGINLDFEYIGKPDDEVRDNFTRFVTNLSSELKRQIPNAVLSIDTYVISGSVRDLFDLQLLSEQVDAFVIMGYDMHYALGNPGPISPMGGTINIIGLVQGYLEKVPSEKLILAVPYYGYDWPINNLDSPNATHSAAILSYAELAAASRDKKLIWDETSQTPSYKYTENGIEREVHYENVRSLGIKYDYVIAKDLKGVGIWALGYDGLNSDLQRLIVDKFTN